MHNRIHNARNPNQGNHKKVLCVCSAGLLRSPTAAVVLSQEPFNFNTRAVGAVPDFALIPLDEVHLHWADEVVVMEQHHQAVVDMLGFEGPILNLNIPDHFEYRDPELMELIKNTYQNFLISVEKDSE